MKNIALLLFLFLLACDDGDLRGSTKPSPDGKTYFVVADDNGGGCGPMLVDGKKWPYATGQKGEIAPGQHKIECGGDFVFTVVAGTTYSFDYWGP